jgi:hypothetical protein
VLVHVLSIPTFIGRLKRMTMAVLVGTPTEFPGGATAASTVPLAAEVAEAPVIICLLDGELPPQATAASNAATANEGGASRFMSASANPTFRR